MQGSQQLRCTIYTIVSQEQPTSQSNGGMAGIYWKANADLNFRATSEDVVGSWNYTDIQHDIGYAANTTGSAILTSLQQMGYLYNTSTGCWNNYPDHSISVGDDALIGISKTSTVVLLQS